MPPFVLIFADAVSATKLVLLFSAILWIWLP